MYGQAQTAEVQMHVRCSTYFEDADYEVLCSSMFIDYFRDIIKVLLTLQRLVTLSLFMQSLLIGLD